MKKSYLAVAALLGSTALAVPAFAQDATAPKFELSGTGGIMGIGLPSYDPGAFGHVAGGTMFGGMLSGKISTVLGNGGDWGAVIGLNVYGGFGVSSTSWSDSITSLTTITGLDRAAVTPTVTVSAGNSTTNITGVGGGVDNQTVTSASAFLNAGGVVKDATGFEVVSGTATGSTGAGFAANGDKSGGILVINSTDGSAKINTTVSRSLVIGGADLTLGMTGTLDGDASVQVYAGPSVKFMSQGIQTSFTADLTEVQPSLGVVTPNFTIAVNDQLSSTYLGGVIGGNVSFKAQPGVTFTLGAEGGAYVVHSTWSGHDTYSTTADR